MQNNKLEIPLELKSLLLQENRPLTLSEINSNLSSSYSVEKISQYLVPTTKRDSGVDHFMLEEQLSEYWCKETEAQLQEEDNQFILIVISEGKRTFEKYYKLFLPRDTIVTAGIQDLYVDYFRYIEPQKQMWSFNYDKSNIKFSTIYLEEASNSTQKAALLAICELLFVTPEYQLSISKLLFKLNRLDYKKYNEQVIINLIKDHSDLIKLSENNVCSVIDRNALLHFFIDSIAQSRYEGERGLQFKRTPDSGILMIRFSGKEFVLREAQEYIEVRPIIFISEIYQNNELVLDGLNRVLSALLNDRSKVDEWIESSTKYYFYTPVTGSRFTNAFVHEMISQYSPILNYENNPTNMFKYTLMQKLDSYENETKVSE